MAYSGYQPPANRIVAGGNPLIQELKVENATNAYPGRAVMKGSNDDDIVVTDGLGVPVGFLGYEQCFPAFMPTNIQTAYAANAMAPVISGDCLINAPGGLAAGTVAKKKQLIAPWAGGQYVPIVSVGGRYGLVIPFTKSATEKATGVTIPAGVVIRDTLVNVTKNVASATINVGTLSTAAGDADGLLVGESLAAAGMVQHNNVDGTAANNTLGALLVESDIESGDNPALTVSIPTGYQVPTGGKQISYTTSDEDVAGDIILILESPGFIPVGMVEKSVSAVAAAADVLFKSMI